MSDAPAAWAFADVSIVFPETGNHGGRVGRRKLADSELTSELITEVAFDILDIEGLEALTLARIARALSIRSSAIYWYFASKSELYTHLCAVMFHESLAALDPELEGRDLLLAFGRSHLASLRSIRGAAKLVSIAGVSEEVRTETVPRLLARVSRGGISPTDARLVLTAVEALALGWALFEGNPATNEVMREVNGSADQGFELALASILSQVAR